VPQGRQGGRRSTGLRRGEALGLQWADVDFRACILTVRRAVTLAGITTPKSGRSRRVAMPTSLASVLMDLLAERRREALKRGWPDVPQWIFCSEVGTAPDPSNADRVWQRVRRRACKTGVRPLKLHCTRHTWATLALQAGKSVPWVADQLGHSDPALTLRVYAHAMREEEQDLSFADFGGPGRPYTAPDDGDEVDAARNVPESLARREGLEPPTLRFEEDSDPEESPPPTLS
jgi:integrase